MTVRERLRGLLTENVGLKAVSLILAFLLWAFVKGTSKGEMTIRVPVEVEGVPDHLIVGKVDPSDVAVRLRGLMHRLNRLKPEEVRIPIELKDARSGLNTFLLRPEDVRIPPGIEVVALSPSEVRMRISELKRKRVPVKVELRGRPAEGYEIGSIRVDPPFVTVSGAKEVVRDLEAVRTEPVNLGDAKETLELEVPLSVGILPLHSLEPKRVKVRVEVRPREALRD
ncbi:MAG: hypothetical protein DRG31_07385 [Deltaproteobacteria bacterium]|nr:MAG: hypothetical protein DRG31_07385 [Deltaproteobacteria bacterium]